MVAHVSFFPYCCSCKMLYFIHSDQHDVYRSAEKTVHKKECEITQHLQHFIFSKGCTRMNRQIVIDSNFTADRVMKIYPFNGQKNIGGRLGVWM